MLWRRAILLPWLLSAVVMFGLSYLWHGVALRDLEELKWPLALYLSLSGLVYLIIGLALTLAMHKVVEHEFISLKNAFPFAAMGLGLIAGFIVYLFVFVFGLSFAKHGMIHVMADVMWQLFEQSIGGLMVSLGMIHDMRQSFLEHERSN